MDKSLYLLVERGPKFQLGFSLIQSQPSIKVVIDMEYNSLIKTYFVENNMYPMKTEFL